MKLKSKLPPKNANEYFSRLAALLNNPSYQQLFDIVHTVIEKTNPRAEGDESACNLHATGEIVLFVEVWVTHILKNTGSIHSGIENRKAN